MHASHGALVPSIARPTDSRRGSFAGAGDAPVQRDTCPAIARMHRAPSPTIEAVTGSKAASQDSPPLPPPLEQRRHCNHERADEQEP